MIKKTQEKLKSDLDNNSLTDDLKKLTGSPRGYPVEGINVSSDEPDKEEIQPAGTYYADSIGAYVDNTGDIVLIKPVQPSLKKDNYPDSRTELIKEINALRNEIELLQIKNSELSQLLSVYKSNYEVTLAKIRLLEKRLERASRKAPDILDRKGGRSL